jgi:hypothetical protein
MLANAHETSADLQSSSAEMWDALRKADVRLEGDKLDDE